MIAKRTGVLADDPVLAARVVDCLRLVGEDAELLDANQPRTDGLARVVATAACLRRIPAGLPAIQLGGAPEDAPVSVAAHLPVPLRLQALLSALHAADGAGESQRGGPAARPVPGLIGTGQAARRMRAAIAKVAETETPVLLTGERGSGQIDVAHALHGSSKRSSGAFVPVDCAALPPETLDSELFGYEKGAFVGALTSKAGRFELASAGTLFLDSVAALPLALQAKLMRAMTDGRVERVGGSELVAATPRVVAADGQALDDAVERGAFREDLYRLLSVCAIEVPSLRERHEDLPALIAHVAARVEAKHDVTLRLTPAALEALAAYDWPRNVRELEHQIERLALVHGHELIDLEQLPSKLHGIPEPGRDSAPTSRDATAAASGLLDPERLPLLPVNGIDLRDYLTSLERSLIQQALNDTHHVVARAADRLHIRRTTLVEKMRKYGLSRLDHDTTTTDAVEGDASA